MRDKVSGAIAISKASWGCAPALPNQIRMVFLRQAASKSRGGIPFCRTLKTVFSKSCFCTVPMWNTASRKTNCIRFGKIALLFAFVLFAGGCVVRIAYECFLDYSLLEVLCFQDGEQHLPISLRFQYHLINTFVKEGSLPSIFKGCLVLLSLRDISPHCGESSTSPSWASSTAVCLRQ